MLHHTTSYDKDFRTLEATSWSWAFFGFRMGGDPLESPQDCSWYRRRYWKVSTLWLETVFVGHVLHGNRGAIRCCVLIWALSLHRWFLLARDVLQCSLLLSCDAVFSLEAEQKFRKKHSLFQTRFKLTSIGTHHLDWYQKLASEWPPVCRIVAGWVGGGTPEPKRRRRRPRKLPKIYKWNLKFTLHCVTTRT